MIHAIEVGAICALAFAAVGLVACYASGEIREWSDRRDRASVLMLRQKVSIDLGRSIACQAYWFSESMDAVRALEAIGEQLQQGEAYGVDISAARDIWREKKIAAKEADQ